MSVNSCHLAEYHGYSKFPQSSIHLLAGLGVSGDAHCGATVQHRYEMQKTPDKPNLKQVHLFPLELLELPSFRAFDRLPVLPGQMGENITTEGLDLHGLGEGYRLCFTHSGCRTHSAMAQVVDATGTRAYTNLTALIDVMTFITILLHYRHLAYAFLLPLLLLLVTVPTIASTCYICTFPYDCAVVRVTGLRKPCQQINEWRDGLLKKCYTHEGGRRKERCGIMGVVERGGDVGLGMKIVVEATPCFRQMRCV